VTTQQDVQVGFGKESTYGTAVTVDHFFETTDEGFDWNPTFAQGAGLRVGRIVNAADRRVLVKEESGGSIDIELFQKGLGFLFLGALGAGTSTVVSGSAFQQVITPATSDFLPSYTVQVGLPPLGGGALNPQTYSGMLCDTFAMKAASGSIPTIKFTYKGKSKSTATALATPSYPAGNGLYTFVQGSLQVGGALTLPTTTALASMTSPTLTGADVREFDLNWNNNLDANGFNLNTAGTLSRSKAVGLRAGTGTMTVEYDANVWRDAFLNQTDLSLVLTFQSTVPITGAVFPTFQVVIPDLRLNGGMPQPNKGEVITTSVGFEVLDNRSASSALYIVIVTPETAF